MASQHSQYLPNYNGHPWIGDSSSKRSYPNSLTFTRVVAKSILSSLYYASSLGALINTPSTYMLARATHLGHITSWLWQTNKQTHTHCTVAARTTIQGWSRFRAHDGGCHLRHTGFLQPLGRLDGFQVDFGQAFRVPGNRQELLSSLVVACCTWLLCTNRQRMETPSIRAHALLGHP